MMVAKTVSSIGTASVAVHRPAPLRQNASEPTFTVWMDVTAPMVDIWFPYTSLLMHIGMIFLLSRLNKITVHCFGIPPSAGL